MQMGTGMSADRHSPRRVRMADTSTITMDRVAISKLHRKLWLLSAMIEITFSIDSTHSFNGPLKVMEILQDNTS